VTNELTLNKTKSPAYL